MSKTKLDLPTRIIIIFIGFVGAISIILFGWDIDFNAEFLGYPITKIFMASMIVILGIIFSSLIKSGILGKWKID